MIEEGIAALLLADSGVSALIGTRIFPVVLPQGLDTYPALIYQDISSPKPDFTLEGTETDCLRIQFDAFGNSYRDSMLVLAAVRNVLSKYVGTLSDGSRVLFAYQSNIINHFEGFNHVYRSVSEYVIEYTSPSSS